MVVVVDMVVRRRRGARARARAIAVAAHYGRCWRGGLVGDLVVLRERSHVRASASEASDVVRCGASASVNAAKGDGDVDMDIHVVETMYMMYR